MMWPFKRKPEPAPVSIEVKRRFDILMASMEAGYKDQWTRKYTGNIERSKAGKAGRYE